MFMNRREHLLNMKNKYLTKCLCITMAAAISFTGTASVFCLRRDSLVRNRNSCPRSGSRADFIRAGIGRDAFRASGDNVRAGTGTCRVCTDTIRAHRNTSRAYTDSIRAYYTRSYTYSDTGSK